MNGAVHHELDLLAHFDAPIDDTHKDDDAAVRIKPRVENQGAQGRFGVAGGRGHPRHHGF